jgi:hypothetical protein
MTSKSAKRVATFTLRTREYSLNEFPLETWLTYRGGSSIGRPRTLKFALKLIFVGREIRKVNFGW